MRSRRDSMPSPVRAEMATPSKRESSARAAPGSSRSILLSATTIGRLHRVHLIVERGVTGVDHVDEEVRLGELLERGLERGHQLVRQLADEADGVGQDEGGVGAAR